MSRHLDTETPPGGVVTSPSSLEHSSSLLLYSERNNHTNHGQAPHPSPHKPVEDQQYEEHHYQDPRRTESLSTAAGTCQVKLETPQ